MEDWNKSVHQVMDIIGFLMHNMGEQISGAVST